MNPYTIKYKYSSIIDSDAEEEGKALIYVEDEKDPKIKAEQLIEIFKSKHKDRKYYNINIYPLWDGDTSDI